MIEEGGYLTRERACSTLSVHSQQLVKVAVFGALKSAASALSVGRVVAIVEDL